MEILFGLTPPRITTSAEKVATIAQRTAERINRINPSRVVVYDIQDESKRNPQPRPFPFTHTHDPYQFVQQLKQHTDVQYVVYKCVVNTPREQFIQWVNTVSADEKISDVVFVGGQKSDVDVPGINLGEAYAIYDEVQPNFRLGGVAIAERHAQKNEAARMIRKMDSGCSFFISQAVYHKGINEELIRDLQAICVDKPYDFPQFYLTLTPCGNERGFEFMDWLGIHVDPELLSGILSADEPINRSVEVVSDIAKNIAQKFPDLPIGVNVESISKKKSEILAAEKLAESVRTLS